MNYSGIVRARCHRCIADKPDRTAIGALAGLKAFQLSTREERGKNGHISAPCDKANQTAAYVFGIFRYASMISTNTERASVLASRAAGMIPIGPLIRIN
jgi:hypothetical protein